jgi:hypothetical protein
MLESTVLAAVSAVGRTDEVVVMSSSDPGTIE